MGWYEIVTSPIMWIIAGITAGNSLVQTILFFRVSRRAALEIGLTREQVTKSLFTGVISSLGPSMGSFVGMVALVIALGGAIAFIRESAGIGSITYELMMCKSAADAAGAQMTREGMTLVGAATVVWGMALTCSPFIITGGVGARLLPKLRDSVLGRRPGLMVMISSSAMLGILGKLMIDYFAAPLATARTVTGYATPAAFVSGMVAALVWLKLADWLKKPVLKELVIIVCIAAGMAGGQFIATIKLGVTP